MKRQKSIYVQLLDFLLVVQDSTSNWQTVKTVILPMVESLCDALSEEDNRGRRLSLQGIAYQIIMATIKKYHETQGIDGTEDDAGVDKIVSRLSDAIFLWFFDSHEEKPNLWRDHKYVSNNKSGNLIDGYFHLSVNLPTVEELEPNLHIIYPETAERNPFIMFRDFNEDGTEGIERGDFIRVDKLAVKEEVEDNTRMFSISGPEVVEKMLEHQIMYISFRSRDTQEEDSDELEVARIPLAQFQEKWREAVDNEHMIIQ